MTVAKSAHITMASHKHRLSIMLGVSTDNVSNNASDDEGHYRSLLYLVSIQQAVYGCKLVMEAVSKQKYMTSTCIHGMGADNKPRFWARQLHPWREWSELSSDDIFGPVIHSQTCSCTIQVHKTYIPLLTCSKVTVAKNSSDDESTLEQLGWTTGDGFCAR